jgi:zinc/manganese transport system substrate-binding protein
MPTTAGVPKAWSALAVASVLSVASGLLLACSSNGSPGGSSAGSSGGDRPTVAVTTNILGDVVENLVAGDADVVTVMPVGVDPHEFQASARDVARVREADALVVNGAGFEEGLADVVDSAREDGVPTVEAAPGGEPHFFTDPVLMADAAEDISLFLGENVPELRSDAVVAAGRDYVEDLRALDGRIRALVDAVPEPDRVLVTNHDVFGAFADRYGFRVVGTVIPAGSTGEAASGGELAELAAEIDAEGVPAIFVDTSAPDRLASTLAEEVGGDVTVVELFSESLGRRGSGASSYVEMMQTNAERMAETLGEPPRA